MSKKVYIASGAGFSGDRFDAAVPLVDHLSSCNGPRYLIFEVLAERTIALAQIAKNGLKQLLAEMTQAIAGSKDLGKSTFCL